MNSAIRFAFVCAVAVLAVPFLVMLAFTRSTPGELVPIVTGVAALFLAPLWVVRAMDNRSRWDVAARYVAMFLLLALCIAAIGAVELLVFLANSAGSSWN